MNQIRVRSADLVAPAVGVVYILLWWVGEAGRLGNGAYGPVVAMLPFLLFGIVIAVSKKWPAVALVLMGATTGLQLLIEGARFISSSWPAYLPLLYAVFNISAFGRRAVHWISLPVSAVYAAVVAALLTVRTFGHDGWPVLYSLQSARQLQSGGGLDIVGTFAAVCAVAVGLAAGAWCAGLAMRRANQVAAARRQAQALQQDLDVVESELVVLSERERLAQDVHDVMAHSLAVIAAQADGTRMLDSELSPDSEQALTTIADTARDGLVELRRLLDANPSLELTQRPGLAGLPALLERVRGAGLAVDYAELGDAGPLTPIQESSVYRIVQESLTNAVRHSRAEGSAKVTLDWRGPGLAVLIATPATDADAIEPGRGIRGMQDRARLAGGWLTVGIDGDAFIVNAFVPVEAARSAEVVA
ncbi:sensor histidine kinase [Microbacterium sp. zg.Y909]|uniref:sensor histidine kinase n=1 Tax=Microbacterium sp. zg.Y909 TaxID=2969413 RepID=UPI00214BFCE9|nr:histidine kinase [Microbacterium sp. zg.Y909]MCR2827667.1 histidine kinase [Microbacterium sp. zg.Y909]